MRKVKNLNIKMQVSDTGDGDIRIEDRDGSVVLINIDEAVLLKNWLDQAGVSSFPYWREEDEE